MKNFFTLLLFFTFPFSDLFSQSQTGSGKSLQFNGFSSYINLGTHNRNITNKLTVEAWIKTTDSKLQMICTKYNNPADHGFQLLISGGKAGLYGRDGNNLYKASGLSATPVNDGNWHHVAGIYNSSHWEIWIDGILENSASFSVISADLSNTATLSIGNYELVNDHFFNGEIDEVRLWNTARTAQEIRENMCRKLPPNMPGLVGYYKLDEGSGNTATDQSSLNISGNLTSFSSSPWRTSGAPIGDASTYIYPASWTNTTLKLPGLNSDTLLVKNMSGNLTGIHIYRVNSAPNSTTGIPNPSGINSYFGVFPSSASSGYSVHYKPATVTCSTDSLVFYKRQHNAITTWQSTGTILNFNTLTFEKTGEVYRSEYIPVSRDAIAKVQITGNQSVCAGSPVTLTASPSATYLWNTGQTTQSITVTNPGTYSVRVTNVPGCSSTDSVVFTPRPVPIANAGPDVAICAGGNIQLGASPTPGYSYLWSPATGLSNPNFANPVFTESNFQSPAYTRSYTLTTFFNGCSTTDQVTVTVNSLPFTAGGNWLSPVTCSGVPLTIGPQADSTFTYSWIISSPWTPATALSNPNIPNPTISITNNTNFVETHQFSVGVTNASGCFRSHNVTVSVNPATISDAGPDKAVCAGQLTSIGKSPDPGHTYSWTPATGLSNANISSPIVTIINNTTNPISQTYTLTSTRSGCTSTDQVTVVVNPSQNPKGNVIVALCNANKHPVGIGYPSVPGEIYSWSPAIGLSSSTVSNPIFILQNHTNSPITQVYTLTTTNQHGCSSTSTYTVIVQPTATPEAGADVSICSGGSAVLGTSATNGYTYSWAPAIGLSDPSLSNPTLTLVNNTSTPITRDYILTVTYFGCFYRDTVTVTVNPLPKAEAGTNKVVCSGQPVTLGANPVAGNTYSWIPSAGLTSAIIANPTLTLTNTSNIPITATYVLTVTNPQGCTSADTVNILVNPLPVSNAGNDVTLCSGDSIRLGTTVTAGYTYNWTPSVGLSDPGIANPMVRLTNLTPVPITRTYTVTSTFFGCTTTDSVKVTVNPAVTVDAGPDKTICGGKSVQIGTPAIPGYTYSWAPNAGLSGTNTATPIFTGTNFGPSPIDVKLFIIATSTATSCSVADSVIIRVNPKPVMDSIAGSPSVCPGVLGVDYHIKNPRLTAYQWIVEGGTIASGQGTPAITVNWGPTGTGKVKTYALNSFGCSSDTLIFDVIINQLLITQKPVGPRQLCFYEAKNIRYQTPIVTNGSFYTYQAFGGTITSPNPSSTGVTVNWHAPGTGKLIVTETSTTNLAYCFGVSDTLYVTINPSPDTVLSIAGPASACAFSQQNTYTLAGGNGSTYAWNFNGSVLNDTDNEVKIDLPAAGTYTLTVVETNSFGCPGRLISKSITATPLPGNLVINGPTIICQNNRNSHQYSVSGLPGSTYAWQVSGGTITSGNGTNTIFVDFDDTRNKQIEVTETSAGNCIGNRFTLQAYFDVSVPKLVFVSTTATNDKDIELNLSFTGNGVNTKSVEIFRREAGTTNPYRKIASVPNNQQSYTDSGLETSSKIYEYKLESENECGTQVRASVNHNTIKLIAKADEKSKTATLTWNTYRGWGQNGVSAYEIYGKADNGTFEKITTAPASDSLFTLRNIAGEGFKQCYRIRAIGTSGFTSWSNINCVNFVNDIVVYNIVTPNNDDKNDFFTVENIHLYPGNELRVFNRWGKEVYSTKDYKNKWSGKDLSDGTYYYYLKLPDGRQYKGWFEIVR
ncbi:LamG-like jellyroll fold domain-containing protein [Adhaeribacter soli]|uniref:T9SS type B sorting domain-containing protein n=1 Tax=Adhaeribacter soli TaxID=2607655 RepID=A0A5N1JAD7_9BACT|nr:LamG-like jellyroll fold domain-containing protein [Adhaeribacter soli]KAA9345809.1 T9SS type B sorting domain-containing protein [Adhaeribacter soli]